MPEARPTNVQSKINRLIKLFRFSSLHSDDHPMRFMGGVGAECAFHLVNLENDKHRADDVSTNTTVVG